MPARLPGAAAPASISSASSATAAQTAMAASQPNIVAIMVDDMVARTMDDLPRLRSLLNERGLSFTSAYVAAPVCCPSRASFLRGQYPHNTNVVANGPPRGGFSHFRKLGLHGSTVATWLHDAGYRTGLIGKYLNHYDQALKHVPPGWDRWFVYGGKGKYRQYRVSDQGKARQYGKKKQRKKYQTDVLARKAVEFIHKTPADTPLFLFLAPSAPHEPATPAERHKKSAVARSTAPRVPSHNEADVSDKPPIWRNRSPLSGKAIRQADKIYTKQLKSMYAVENMIEDVYEALESTSRWDNTYIFFFSDNGYHHGEHRVGLDKNTPFEESTLTPLIVVGPGVPAGATSEALVSLIDLGPTFAELAGVAPPEFVDGRSLRTLLNGNPPGGWRDAVISELLRGPAGGFVVLRTDDPDHQYAYTEYGSGQRELYDLKNDPYQLDNIAETADQSLLDQLRGRFDALARCGAEGAGACQEVDGG